jgi:asparagine synthase (glutamine-hydrolysing)
MLYGDLRFHLPNDMLVKADRMSMAHSLEVRVPLLDLELVRFCFSIPEDLKLRGRRGKYLLRRSLEDALPPDILRRRKAGFVVPVESWMRGPLQPILREFLSESALANTGLIRPKAAQAMIADHARGRRDHAYELFTLLVWSLWWRIWIDGSLALRCVTPAAAPVTIRRLTASSPGP